MGNSLGGKKTTKVMKIDGQTMKFKTPVYAGEIVKNYPGHVLLDSEAVKHFGVRAKPLEPQQELRGKRLYFLVELPKVAEERAAPAEVEKLMMQSKDEGEAAEKLMQLCIANNGNAGGLATKADQIHPQPRCDQGIIKKSSKSREKRVGFLPVIEGEIRHLAVAS
nr:uncharacterized protein At1g66480-like [Ipomoea batatas]